MSPSVFRRRKGAHVVEYGFVLALIFLVAFGAVVALSERTRCALWSAAVSIGLPVGNMPPSCVDPNDDIALPPAPPPASEMAETPEILAQDLVITHNQTIALQIPHDTAGLPEVRFSVVSGQLPPGITLSPGGIISGTPTVPGMWIAEARVADATNPARASTASLRILVNMRPVFNGLPSIISVPTGAIDTIDVDISDPESHPLSFDTSALPSWISIAPLGDSLYRITFDASARSPDPNPIPFSITVSDIFGASEQVSSAVLVVDGPVWRTPERLPTARIGTLYDQTLVASGISPLSYEIIEGQPSWTTFFATNGRLLGTPSAPSDDSFTVRVTDALGRTAVRTFQLIAGVPPTCPQETTAFFEIGVAGVADLPAACGLPAATLAAQGGAVFLRPGYRLPQTLVLQGATLSSSGLFSWKPPTPTAPQSFQIILRDANGLESQPMQVRVFDNSIVQIMPGQILRATVGQRISREIALNSPSGLQATLSLVSGALPPGMSLVGNAVTGTPAETGTWTVRIQATDPFGRTSEADVAIHVGQPPVWLTAPDLGVVQTGISTLLSVSATDPDGDPVEIVWTNLPNWVIASGGQIQVTPPPSVGPGPFTLRAEARDGVSQPVPRIFSFQVAQGLVWPDLSAFPRFVRGKPYETSFTIPGAAAITISDLPTWITATVQDTTVMLSGIPPTDAMDVVFRVSATTLSGATDQRSGILLFNRPPAWLQDADLGLLKTSSVQINVVDPDDTPSLSLDGELPTGATLSIVGTRAIIANLPPGAGSFTLRATDGHNPPILRTFSFFLNRPPIWTGPTFFQATPDTPFTIEHVASDPDGDPIVVEQGGLLPSGWTKTVSANRITIQGVLTAEASDVIYAVSARDPWGAEAIRQVRISLPDSSTAAAPTVSAPIWIAPTAGPHFRSTGETHTIPLQATATDPAAAGVVFSAASILPPGVSVSGTSLQISVPPGSLSLAQRNMWITLEARHVDGAGAAYGPASHRLLRLVLNTPPRFVQTPPETLPDAVVGQLYGPLVWQVVDDDGDPISIRGNLPFFPANLWNVSGNTITLHGVVPTSPGGPQTGTLVVEDPFGVSGGQTSHTHVLNVRTPPIWNALDSLPGWSSGTPYDAALPVVDPQGLPLTIQQIDGVLPNGLSIVGTRIVGTPVPQEGGDRVLRLRATNTLGQATEANLLLRRNELPPVWQTPPGLLGIAVVGRSVDPPWTLQASDPEGHPGLTYRLAPGQTLPDGLTLAANGLLSGTPAPQPAALFEFLVEAVDRDGRVAQRLFAIQINNAPIWTLSSQGRTSAQLLAGFRPNVAVSHDLLIADPDGHGLTVSVQSGSIPPGWVLERTGVAAWRLRSPTTPGAGGIFTPEGLYTYTLRLTDDFGASTDLNVSTRIRLSNRAPILNYVVQLPPEGFMPGLPVRYEPQTTDPDGDAIVLYRISSGSLPTGLTFDPITGIIEGQVPSTNTTFSVIATDALGLDSAPYNINIWPRTFAFYTVWDKDITPLSYGRIRLPPLQRDPISTRTYEFRLAIGGLVLNHPPYCHNDSGWVSVSSDSPIQVHIANRCAPYDSVSFLADQAFFPGAGLQYVSEAQVRPETQVRSAQMTIVLYPSAHSQTLEPGIHEKRLHLLYYWNTIATIIVEIPVEDAPAPTCNLLFINSNSGWSDPNSGERCFIDNPVNFRFRMLDLTGTSVSSLLPAGQSRLIHDGLGSSVGSAQVQCVSNSNGAAPTLTLSASQCQSAFLSNPLSASMRVGVPVDRPLTVDGLSSLMSVEILSGSLPPGLSIVTRPSSTGGRSFHLVGTPTSAGSGSLQIRVGGYRVFSYDLSSSTTAWSNGPVWSWNVSVNQPPYLQITGNQQITPEAPHVNLQIIPFDPEEELTTMTLTDLAPGLVFDDQTNRLFGTLADPTEGLRTIATAILSDGFNTVSVPIVVAISATTCPALPPVCLYTSGPFSLATLFPAMIPGCLYRLDAVAIGGGGGGGRGTDGSSALGAYGGGGGGGGAGFLAWRSTVFMADGTEEGFVSIGAPGAGSTHSSPRPLNGGNGGPTTFTIHLSGQTLSATALGGFGGEGAQVNLVASGRAGGNGSSGGGGGGGGWWQGGGGGGGGGLGGAGGDGGRTLNVSTGSGGGGGARGGNGGAGGQGINSINMAGGLGGQGTNLGLGANPGLAGSTPSSGIHRGANGQLGALLSPPLSSASCPYPLFPATDGTGGPAGGSGAAGTGAGAGGGGGRGGAYSIGSPGGSGASGALWLQLSSP